MKRIITFILLNFLCLAAFSQVVDVPLTPANDPHWELKWSDEFSINAKTQAEWNTHYGSSWKRDNYYDHYGEPKLFLDTNVYVEDGKLIIKLESDSCQCPYPYSVDSLKCKLYWDCKRQWKMYDSLGIDYYYKYSAGSVETKRYASNQYGRFGYMEARINFPYHYSFWHAFWTHRMNGDDQQVLNEAEIDIEQEGYLIENPDGFIYPSIFDSTNYSVIANTQNYTTNGIYRCYDNVYMNEQGGWRKYFKPTYVHNYSWEYGNWHTYAIEWSPTRIIWYIDDMPIRQLENHGIVDTVKLMLGLGFLNDFENDTGLANLTFPQKMEVDYVRVYQLKKECEEVFEACNYDFANYDNRVKKKIIIGDGNCSNAISERTILRASESVEINENFELEEGVELYIDVDGCTIEDIDDIMQYKCASMGASEYE